MQTFSRLGAMASNSSMKIIAGEFFSASSKAFRRLLSDSPASLLMISGPTAQMHTSCYVNIWVIPVSQKFTAKIRMLGYR